MNQAQPDNDQSNILVVDDTPANLRLLVNMLTDKGYKVRAVPNGKLALSAVSLSLPDLILLDIMMPEMNGYEVCENLKANDLTRDIPVIFISAINEVLDKVKAFGVGGIDYISKPFQLEEVLARVETHLALRELQKSLQSKNNELVNTLEQLQAAQSQLIESEKMAALGQLIAGISHELNTPLGAINSSVSNIANFWNNHLEELPLFFQKLSPERQADFLILLQKSRQQNITFSTREQRKIRKALTSKLESYSIDKSATIANLLLGIGVYQDLETFLPLLKDPESEKILKTAYQLATVQTSTKNIATASERATKIVFALKTYAHYDHTIEKRETKIIEGIETVLTLYQNQLRHGVEVIKNYDYSLPAIFCYPDELNQVWTNLIHNALQAMDNKGNLTIEVTRQDANIRVSITDSGKGISPEIQPKIFQPFFTTKPPGEGSGLGLDIVKKIIDKHQGQIEVESVPGKTTFTVYLSID
ncbi:MAG: response regulator [Symploca sp. SIO2C1]|nr:response regulator [Symploca sp. SIO2C1]